MITVKKGLIVLKKLKQGLNQDDIKTLRSIHEAWQEIENGKGGKAKASKKFVDEFNFMARHAEAVAKKLWNNKEDEIWNKL